MFTMEVDEDDYFNQDYVEVDRIIDVAKTTNEKGKEVTHYLVKWRSLPYEESTWELPEDCEPAKIKMFMKFKGELDD